MNLRRQMLRWRLRNGKITEAAYAGAFSHPPARSEFTRIIRGQGKPQLRAYERRYHPTKGWRTTLA